MIFELWTSRKTGRQAPTRPKTFSGALGVLLRTPRPMMLVTVMAVARLKFVGAISVVAIAIMSRLAESRLKTLPIDHKVAARGFVLLLPVHEQIEASMVDVIKMFEMHVQLPARRNCLKLGSQSWKSQKSGGALQVKRRPFAARLVVDSHFEMRKRRQQL
jgi:hypothetical protein